MVLFSLAAACRPGEPRAPGPAPAPAPLDPGATYLADELTDDAALLELADWSGLPVLRRGRTRAFASSHDPGGAEPLGLALIDGGNRDMNQFLCASADADAQEQLVDVVLALPECPDLYVRGFVLGRFEGAGHLTRLQMTALSLLDGAADAEVVRVYVDDRPDPVVQVPLRDLVDGGGSEILAPPFGAGLPSHIVWYYPVAFSERLVVSLDHLSLAGAYYFQVGAALDGQPHAAPPERSPARDAAIAALSGDPPAGDTRWVDGIVELLPGDTAPIGAWAGPGTIDRACFAVDAARVGELDGVWLTAEFDGEATIDLPLGELLGASLDPPETASLALATTAAGGSSETCLRLPMPFAASTAWTVRSSLPAALPLAVTLSGTTSLPPDPWGHLRVVRAESLPGVAVHEVVDWRGEGRLVGVCGLLEGGPADVGIFADPFNFLEGDETVTVDDAPPLLGTGTEDYFESAFYYLDGPFGAPFGQAHGIVVESDDAARVTTCRWHALGEAVDFASRLTFDLEVGPPDPATLRRYRTVAFLYTP